MNQDATIFQDAINSANYGQEQQKTRILEISLEVGLKSRVGMKSLSFPDTK